MNFKEHLEKANTIREIAAIRDRLDVISKEWQESENKLRSKLKEKYEDESVLVVRSEDLIGLFEEGFTQVTHLEEKEIMETITEKSFFMPRYKMEYNPTFKQIIPYVIAVTEDQDIFALVRKSGDPRLVGNISIGIGGHINPVDNIEDNDKLMQGLKRELAEEVNIGEKTYGKLTLEGFVHDSSNAVGRDHLGLIYKLHLTDRDISVKETQTLSGRFFSIKGLKNSVNNLENWSQIVVENLL